MRLGSLNDGKRSMILPVIICIVLLLAVYCGMEYYKTKDVVAVQSTSYVFYVHTKYPNYRDAIKLVEEVNTRALKLLAVLKDKYDINRSYNSSPYVLSDDVLGFRASKEYVDAITSGSRRRQVVNYIVNRYNPEVIYENDPQTSSDTSFTMGKGNSLHLCLRRKDQPMVLHDLGILMYVFLHEISHIGNESYGHEYEFWRVFKFILGEAITAGIYTPVDYSKQPITYCGLYVDYNPYYDDEVKSV